MKRILTIDIETLPPSVPIQEGNDNKGQSVFSDDYLKMALNGDFGRILCIGYVDEDSWGSIRRGVIGWNERGDQFIENESRLLIEFWQMLKGFRISVDQIVGHNIFDFDLKFIYKRSVICGVRPTIDFSFARYRNKPIFDTMYEWERWSYGSKISLDNLAKALSLVSSKKAGINGSNIFDLFQSGQHRAIYDYCLRDVELTRAIYRRMVYADCIPQESGKSLSNSKNEDRYATA